MIAEFKNREIKARQTVGGSTKLERIRISSSGVYESEELLVELSESPDVTPVELSIGSDVSCVSD